VDKVRPKSYCPSSPNLRTGLPDAATVLRRFLGSYLETCAPSDGPPFSGANVSAAASVPADNDGRLELLAENDLSTDLEQDGLGPAAHPFSVDYMAVLVPPVRCHSDSCELDLDKPLPVLDPTSTPDFIFQFLKERR